MALSVRRVVPAGATVLAAALAVGTLAACSGGASGDTSPSSSAPATQSGAHVADVTITAADGCSTSTSNFAAGGITFNIQNKDATAVSEVELLDGERIIGERENIPPGLNGNFAVKVDAGTYTLYCPGAKTERTPLTVTGKAAVSDSPVTALLEQATAGYKSYVDAQISYLVSTAKALDRTLSGTSLKAAQVAYMKSRPYYEKIEPVAESFTIGKNSLDTDIDARPDGKSITTIIGYHRIEYGLFEKKSLAGMTTFGDGLVANVLKLQKLAAKLTYQAPELANGASELLNEVATSKITGEEEAYSDIDLLDFANNDEGAEQAFAQLQPALKRIDAPLTATITARFAALDRLVNTYRTTTNASGYELYPALTAKDKRSLAAAVTAVQAPLASVGSKVANA